ncbi:FtsX-like permease family protein [Streptomyces sp. NPDC052225]|uniref:ABC transporter permease n=1 Tax=Streptomyces sp. NPDC052225 TaxID=3154949 RepID=UPI003444B1F3
MSALGKVVRAGVARRRVPAVVICLTTLMAVAASVLAGTLLVSSRAPFTTAFGKQHGAHLSVQYDANKVKSAALKGSSGDGVSATAGPFRTTTASPVFSAPDGMRGTVPRPLTVIGRSHPGGAVDRLTLTEGRWPRGAGEITLSADAGLPITLGGKLTFEALPGKPTLTVVGLARSVSRTGDAWVLPAQIGALTPQHGPRGYEMLYRLNSASTKSQVAAVRKELTASVPAGSVAGTRSWLTLKAASERETAVYIPFLLAFGGLGLVMSVLIVGNVVAGTVGAGLRRIGILKAVGFTPHQVVRAYLAQALVPAAVGAALGVVAGHLTAVPLLQEAENAYSSTPLTIAPWVDAAVLAVVLGVVALTAWLSAWRAGRLRAVDAIAVGRAARPGRGRWAAGLAARLPLPRPVCLGLARPFGRPARALAMAAAVGFGAVAVTFTLGLGSSLNSIMDARQHDNSDVTVASVATPQTGGPPQAPGPGEDDISRASAAARVIAAQPGTRAYYGLAETRANALGLSDDIDVTAFTGDASWADYRLMSGRWFTKAGEAVVPSGLLKQLGVKVGDTVTFTAAVENGKPFTVRIVGEVFETSNFGTLLLTDLATLKKSAPNLAPRSYQIKLNSGTNARSYATALTAALKEKAGSAHEKLEAHAGPLDDSGGSDIVDSLNALGAMLTLMIVAVAALGVLNGVVLDTRERVQELGVHKALGMTPRQTAVMVVTSVVLTGLAGGAGGVLLGRALHHWIVPAMGEGAGVTLPDFVLAVYHAPQLALLVLGGVLIAVLGALLPAGWAARIRTATALRTE